MKKSVLKKNPIVFLGVRQFNTSNKSSQPSALIILEHWGQDF